MEVDETAVEPVEPDNAETIERILGERIGKKGGIYFIWELINIHIEWIYTN